MSERSFGDSPLRVGDLVEAYAGGMIKCYGPPVRVEAMGHDWVVVRDSSGEPRFADCYPEELVEYRQEAGHA